ncbi:MAG: hydroxyacid dehydrogenase [Planctomycetota bacterium]
MRPKILISDSEVCIGQHILDQIETRADITRASSLDQHALAEEISDKDVAIFSSFSRMTRRVLEAGSKLRAVIKYGVGVDNVDFEAAAERGVVVINCPDYGSRTVAEHAFCLMISLAKRLVPVVDDLRDKGWIHTAPEYQGMDLGGKTLGLYGFGRIGKEMAQIASGFGMRRIAYNPNPDHEAAKLLGVELVSRDEILAVSDFLSLHCVHTPETRHTVNERFFSEMKSGAYLVNVSRGELVVDEDLVAALDSGHLAGAALDVYNEEPLPSDHPFRGRRDVILTPHFAWYTKDAQDRIDQQILERVTEVLDGESPKNQRTSALS